jgi:hypothetical protein
MAQQLTIVGSSILLYINNKLYNVVKSLSFSVEYGENIIHGIDSLSGQEIAPGKISVSGSIQGIRTKMSGGIQGINARPLFMDAAASPYISLRVVDRATKEDIIFLPQTKITNEQHSVGAKGVYSLSFNFVSLIPEFALDRS